MSEKQNSGAPTETQPSGGFGGERRDSEASEQSLSRRVSRETSEPPEQSTPPQRNKPSSFYVYLAILFGAAFLMLLLAYFVQQRNSETVRDNLRTATASREELLEDIQRLEEENLDLVERNEALSVQLKELQEEIDDLFKQVATEHHAYVECYDRFEVFTQFALLEQALRNQDWDTAVRRVRALCSGVLELDKARYELPGEPPFDPQARLTEIISLLEKEGILAPGAVAVPEANASDG